ncbi:MAG: HU family DNA-binding protein [Prevotella sp.]|nr:HU family DNA-binding protein [Prevotella sp.]
MSKISELSRCLVSRYTISQADADRFAREFFNVVKTNLEIDKIVKIRGLGTFKLVETTVRETIDINTRERITVGGNRRIVFTPETAVRNRINSPFQQFETLEVAGATDFSDIDSKYSAEEKEVEKTVVEIPCEPEMPLEDDVEKNAPVVETNVKAVETNVKAVETNVKVVETNPTTKAAETAAADEAGTVVATKIVPAESTEKSAVLNDLSSSETLETGEAANEETAEEETTDKVADEAADEEAADDGVGRGRWLKIAAAIVVLLAIVLSCYYGYNAGWFGKNAALNVGLANNSPAQPSASEPSANEPSAGKILPADSLGDASKHAEKSGILEDSAALPKAEMNYDSDPRVRLGAYVITGLDTVVTVAAGQTLKGISRAFFGDGMECYVEAFNGGVTSVSAGDKLKIPKLRSKKSLHRQAAD